MSQDLIDKVHAFIEIPKKFHAASISQMPAKGEYGVGKNQPDVLNAIDELDAGDVLQGLGVDGLASGSSGCLVVSGCVWRLGPFHG